MQLPSMVLDYGIHARMTGLKIIVFNNGHLPRLVNTFTVSRTWERDKPSLTTCPLTTRKTKTRGRTWIKKWHNSKMTD